MDKITAAEVGTVLSLYGYCIDVSEQKNPRVNGFATKCEISVTASTKRNSSLYFSRKRKQNTTYISTD